jgi:UDP-N-acetylmuramate--alanine ligase
LYKILADLVTDNDVIFAQGAGNIGDIAQSLAATELNIAKLLERVDK